MKVFRTVKEVREFRASLDPSLRLGFVPTMGCLHDGHAALMDQAKKSNDVVIVSIFVNPTQFAANEDYGVYPRTWDSDVDVCTHHGVSAIFFPSDSEMYPEGPAAHRVYVEVGGANDQVEGQCRPHMFRAVATVCIKLFNIVQPHNVYFGQKDAMQCAVIRTMVQDLNVPVTMNICPTIREHDGLAMSSRNKYLTPHQRTSIAPLLYKALCLGVDAARVGKKAGDVRRIVQSGVNGVDGLELVYVSIGEKQLLQELPEEVDVTIGSGAVISIAAKLGSTRLIDNVVL
jgi:pantoate--beta-alanine ligase